MGGDGEIEMPRPKGPGHPLLHRENPHLEKSAVGGRSSGSQSEGSRSCQQKELGNLNGQFFKLKCNLVQ